MELVLDTAHRLKYILKQHRNLVIGVCPLTIFFSGVDVVPLEKLSLLFSIAK